MLHGNPTKDEYYDRSLPSMSNSEWLPWLQAQLLKGDIAAYTPEVPQAYKTDWNDWCREVERYEIDSETCLVGHSCGGGFWVRYLSERQKLRVGKVILVAPWLDPDGDETNGFFDFTIDPKIASRTEGLVIFNSDNDMGNVHKSVARLREAIRGIEYTEFHKYGHFTAKDMNSSEFPELLKVVAE